MAPVWQEPGKDKPRDSALFAYLKAQGAWIWGYPDFVPVQGDIFLTGTYADTNNQGKSRGSWTFQHVAVVAKILPNADGTYTILSQDGGKGQASIGEDKTGYTIRNYDAKTRFMSGAKPRVLIGVWRPGALKTAIENMPPEIRSSLKGKEKTAYEAWRDPYADLFPAKPPPKKAPQKKAPQKKAPTADAVGAFEAQHPD